jgi:hypothetical protein
MGAWFGLDVPRVVLLDRSAVAGNWSGQQGYMSGLLPLGRPPEKDVCFPYTEHPRFSLFTVVGAG